MRQSDYFMDSDRETTRLDIKTDRAAVEAQAAWAGVAPGMRVADLGCGSGKTTVVLNRLVQPGGTVIGVDASKERLDFARSEHGAATVEYHRRDLRRPLEDLGGFDLVWIRFVLEYYRAEAQSMVHNIYQNVKPGGTICLIDLDYNCLTHFGLSRPLESKLTEIVIGLSDRHNFDPFMGRKLYSFLHDLGCEEITVNLEAHHLIYGKLAECDRFNWLCKVEAARPFFDSDDEYQAFYEAFTSFFTDPRRFTYTPLILCKGRKPVSAGE